MTEGLIDDEQGGLSGEGICRSDFHIKVDVCEFYKSGEGIR